jgi:hypothetical protein
MKGTMGGWKRNLQRLEQIIGLRNCETNYKSSEIIYAGVEADDVKHIIV